MAVGSKFQRESSCPLAQSRLLDLEKIITAYCLLPTEFMAHDRFIEKHKTAWQRLEDLLKLLDGSSLRKLHREEVRELGKIYRRTSSDLAVARAESRDPRLINYLNSLVIRAHGRIYQADAQGGSRITSFFAQDFPQTFRRTWRYTAVSFSVFALFSLSILGTKYDPEFSELLGRALISRSLHRNENSLVGRSERS